MLLAFFPFQRQALYHSSHRSKRAFRSSESIEDLVCQFGSSLLQLPLDTWAAQGDSDSESTQIQKVLDTVKERGLNTVASNDSLADPSVFLP